MKKKTNTPTIITKVLNFSKALYLHIITGIKKSSQKEILHRYNICQGCEFFSFISDNLQIKASCNICGCNLSDQKITMNKLAWKEQQCPKGKW